MTKVPSFLFSLLKDLNMAGLNACRKKAEEVKSQGSRFAGDGKKGKDDARGSCRNFWTVGPEAVLDKLPIRGAIIYKLLIFK